MEPANKNSNNHWQNDRDIMHKSRSLLIASGLAIAVVVWMSTGLLRQGGSSASIVPDARPESGRTAMAVTVLNSQARQVSREIAISARTEPNRRVDIAAETEGRVIAVEAERGMALSGGDPIVVLDMRDRRVRAEEAEALVRQRELEYQGAVRLRDREFMSESQIAEADALLAAARANLARIRLEMEQTVIKAPFAGVLEERQVELGGLVRVGDTIGTLVDTNPLIVTGHINEGDIDAVKAGDKGQARLLDGEQVSGTVRYIAPAAAESTRTFRVELAIPNPGNRLRAGMSAEILLPGGEVTAHRVTPALLSLDEDGVVGVKTVDGENIVRFFPVDIVHTDPDGGIWITGPPPQARVIVVGQGFVTPGENVRPVDAGDTPATNGFILP